MSALREIRSDGIDAVVLYPGRLWSLWDIMMNYGVFGLCHLLKDLAIFEERLVFRLNALSSLNTSRYAKELRQFIDPNVKDWDRVTDIDLEQVKGWLLFSTQQADILQLQAVHDRVDIFQRKLRFESMTLQDLLAEVRALREAFESGLPFKRFYLYPEAKAQLWLRFSEHWSAVIPAFPKAVDDAKAAVDCYGMGHHTASVFHSMRVVEHGLRELAAAVNVKFEQQMWHGVIEQIEKEIRAIDAAWPSNVSKSDWMSFYSGAAKEFFYFKAGWRNYVSHGGDPYDDPQALGVLEHVRAFMTHLASRLGAPSAAA